ncbi:MAG: ABC transporter permease [Cyanobacteria bacterium J06598_3]
MNNPQMSDLQTSEHPSMMALDAEAIAQMVAARREGGLWRTLNDMSIVAWRNLLLEVRSPASLLVSTFFTISLLCVFTASFAKVFSDGGSFSSYAQFLLPFTIVQGLLFNTVNISNFFFEDLDNGMDVRLRAMPIARLAAVGGRFIASGARLLFQVVGIVLAGYFLGFRLQGGIFAAIGFLLLPVIFTLAVAMMGFYVAVGAKSAEGVAAVLNPWILPLTFLSIGYVPKEGFPNWAQGFVTHNPVSVVSEAMRALASGDPALASVSITLGWSALFMVVFGWMTLKAYKHRI